MSSRMISDVIFPVHHNILCASVNPKVNGTVFFIIIFFFFTPCDLLLNILHKVI